MKYLFYYLILLLFIGCNKSSSIMSDQKKDILKDCKIEKLKLINNYWETDVQNKLHVNWKEFNRDFKTLKLLIVDNAKPEKDFFFVNYIFEKRLSNCKDLTYAKYILRYFNNKIYIYRWVDKNRNSNHYNEYIDDGKFNKYLYGIKRDTISWNELKQKFYIKQDLFGFNNKIDSLEYIILHKNLIEYFSIDAQSGIVFGPWIPLDTIINYRIVP